ncbi:MAG TPA: four helix bundle protein [Terracidiphilus sp.]|nr:four helix bundle protein [Terracidiphilus sp.]
MAQAFQDLTVWQRAMELSECVYRLTKSFPTDELYGMKSHLRRASISAASNIAEGRGRATQGEFKQLLCIAQGSTYEVHTQLLLAKRLKIGDEKTLRSAEAICIETSKMLGAFIASLGKKS